MPGLPWLPAAPAARPDSSVIPLMVSLPPVTSNSRTLPWPSSATWWPFASRSTASDAVILSGLVNCRSVQSTPNCTVPPLLTARASAGKPQVVSVAAGAVPAAAARPWPGGAIPSAGTASAAAGTRTARRHVRRPRAITSGTCSVSSAAADDSITDCRDI